MQRPASLELYELPPDVVAFVDSLEPGGVVDDTPAGVIDLRLTYGSVEMEDGPLETLHDELTAAKEAYLLELENFVSISPEHGLPSSLTQGELRRSLHQANFTDSQREFDTWLDCAAKHLPETASEAIDEVVEIIVDNFDVEQVELAIGLAEAKNAYRGPIIRDFVHEDGRRLFEAVAGQIWRHSLNIDTARRFVASSLTQRYSRDNDRLRLEQHIIELENQQDPSQSRERLIKFLPALEQALAGGDTFTNGLEELLWVIKGAPDLLAGVIARNPTVGHRARKWGSIILRSLPEARRTDEHETALSEIEAMAGQNLKEYTDFLAQHIEQGAIPSADQIAILTDLAIHSPLGTVDSWAWSAICALAPLGQLVELIENRSDIFSTEQTVAICVRRLAQGGQLAKAHKLVEIDPSPYSSNQVREHIHRLLVIYEEAGDETAWQKAIALSPQISSYSYFTHEFAARRFVAALKQGNAERAEAAAADMELGHTNPAHDKRRRALGVTVRLFLDSGDLDTAELFAYRLFNEVVTNDIAIHRSYGRLEGLLTVMQARMDQGQADEVARMAHAYIFTQSPPDHNLGYAVKMLRHGHPEFLPDLLTPHLNEVTNVLRGRR